MARRCKNMHLGFTLMNRNAGRKVGHALARYASRQRDCAATPEVQSRVQLLSQREVSKVLPTGVFESRHIVGELGCRKKNNMIGENMAVTKHGFKRASLSRKSATVRYSASETIGARGQSRLNLRLYSPCAAHGGSGRLKARAKTEASRHGVSCPRSGSLR